LSLPQFVLAAQDAIREPGAKYYFWSGNGKLKTAITDWQEKLQDVFALAKIENGRAHRFRGTFACELLLASVPIERVSKLLAHGFGHVRSDGAGHEKQVGNGNRSRVRGYV